MPQRIRPVLAWSPVWEGPTKQWAECFIRKNRWRCDRIHDPDDLLQDAYLTFLKICKRYPRVMGQAHFMTLFRSAMTNEMHDRARYMQRKRQRHQDTAVDASDLGANRIGDVSHNGYLTLLIEQASQEIRAALAMIGQNPPALHKINGHRENLNMKLQRMLGGDPTIDLVGEIRTLLEA